MQSCLYTVSEWVQADLALPRNGLAVYFYSTYCSVVCVVGATLSFNHEGVHFSFSRRLALEFELQQILNILTGILKKQTIFSFPEKKQQRKWIRRVVSTVSWLSEIYRDFKTPLFKGPLEILIGIALKKIFTPPQFPRRSNQLSDKRCSPSQCWELPMRKLVSDGLQQCLAFLLIFMLQLGNKAGCSFSMPPVNS